MLLLHKLHSFAKHFNNNMSVLQSGRIQHSEHPAICAPLQGASWMKCMGCSLQQYKPSISSHYFEGKADLHGIWNGMVPIYQILLPFKIQDQWNFTQQLVDGDGN